MSSQLAETFIKALERLEADRDVDGLVSLFSDASETGNVVVGEKFHGPEGAREFWTKYRDTFDEIRSTFRNKIAEDGRVALEWQTEGSGPNGVSLQYEGVSIIEIEGDKITRFRAYFDSSALGKQMEQGAGAVR